MFYLLAAWAGFTVGVIVGAMWCALHKSGVEVWEAPREGEVYIIGLDPAAKEEP